MTVKCTICEKELSSTEGYLIMELRKSSVDYTRNHYCYTCYQDLCIDDSVRRLVGLQESRKGVKHD